MGRETSGPRSRWHPEVRQRKARKILAVLKDHLNSRMDGLRCLDLGCSSGAISALLSEHFGTVVGVDVDGAALATALQTERPNLSFLMADAGQLPFGDESFDVVVCAQVYEHVSTPAALFAEIRRVLKGNGVCFFSGPNKLAPMEAHHALPFVHWLPKPLGDYYIRAAGKSNSYDERPLFLWQLKGLARGFDIVDYTAKIIKDPVIYSCEDEVKPRWVSRIPARVLRLLIFTFPNYNWVLRKRDKTWG